MARYIKADITPIIKNESKFIVQGDVITCGKFFITKDQYKYQLSIFMNDPNGSIIVIEPTDKEDLKTLEKMYEYWIPRIEEHQLKLAEAEVSKAFKALTS